MHAHGPHQITFDAVFRHPVARNLQWREVRAMLDSLADTVEEHDDAVKFTRNGQTLTVRPPRRKDVSDAAEVMRIRHFLERSAEPETAAAAVVDGHHLLVVIDHRQARVFRAELRGTVPQRITLLDPHGTHRYLHAVGDDANGQRQPEPKAFYDAVAAALVGAEAVLILGTATGASSAMDHLVGELKRRHPAIARRVVATVVVDEHHMTDDQLLAQARAYFTKAHA